MKKNLLLALAAIALLASCNRTMQKPDGIEVNPNPLTVVGNKVDATITGTFPAKKFNRNGILTVTPVLKFDGQEAVGETVTYVGEKVKENGRVVKYKEGGKYSQTCSFDYVPAMDKSELYLRFTAKVGKKVIEIPDVKVAEGLLSTAKLAKADDNLAVVTPDAFNRIIQETKEADIKFLIQQTSLRNSELKGQDIKELQAAIREAEANQKKLIDHLEISGYASPDGAEALNSSLAEKRQANAQKFLQRQLKKDKIEAEIESSITAEDWEGFQEAVAKSNLQDKDLVLRVLSMYSDPEEREAQIKNISAVYSTLAEEILPALRRSRLMLVTNVIGKSDEEISQLAKEDASALNVEELLYAATLTNDDAEKMAIYQKVADLYNDYRAYNNMGRICFGKGDMAQAKAYYDKALALEPSNVDVNYNAGLCELAMGDLASAEQHLGKANGTTGNLNAALGTLYTMKGDYQNATAAYGKVATNNAAVQQILNEDYAGAMKTLQSVDNPNATTYYLLAVVAARTNNRDAVLSNLQEAVTRDASLKAKAQNDIEFARLAEDEAFLAIVK